MDGRANADARCDLKVDASCLPNPKDMQGPDNPVPLSSQWLLPKPVDNNHEHNFSAHHGSHPDTSMVARHGEDFPDVEKKDVFGTSDAETGRRGRWRDEERDTNTVCRDRWREGDKELGDSRRAERWTDHSSKHGGEARRVSSERWADSVNRENNYDQRRESKWNSRWGPDNKESDNWREKWSDSTRDGEASQVKGTPQLTNPGKDINNYSKDLDKNDDHHSRLWRSNSYLSRGRVETSNNPSLPATKPAPMFAYGRGRGENGPPVFPAGRGRGNPILSTGNSSSSRSHALGTVSDKYDGAYVDSRTTRYTRIKLLDILRMADISNCRMLLEDFVDIPSLTVGVPLEPLALSAPAPEESVILKGIEKGDIISSGLPQYSKDGSVGRSSFDSVPLKHTKPGTDEDWPSAVDDDRDDTTDHGQALRFESFVDKTGATVDLRIPERLSPDYADSPRRQLEERSSYDCNSINPNVRTGWSHLQADLESEWKNDTSISSTNHKDESLWQENEEYHLKFGSAPLVRKQSSEVSLEREGNLFHDQGDSYVIKENSVASRLQPHLSPENLTLYYKDPQGQIQGPFSGSDLIGWFEAGYFGIDLPVRIASASVDAPFSVLGDVMPHLRMKSRPPPGFKVVKQNDVELPNTVNFSLPISNHGNATEFELLKNGHLTQPIVANEAENRYFESLMARNISTSPPKHVSYVEGIQDCGGRSSSMSSVVGENANGISYLLAQQLSLDHQSSLPNPQPFWPGGDASLFTSKTDFLGTSLTNSKSLPPMGDNSHNHQTMQHVDLLSMLQAAAEKPMPQASSTVNSGIPVWPNFRDVQSLNNDVHGGMGIIQDKMDMHQNQCFAPQTEFGGQVQRLQPQNQPSLSHLINQPAVFSSGLVPSDKLLPPDISHDPQMQTLLQHKLMLSQLQMQSQPVHPTQFSPLDMYLLQQQQQQQQQEQHHQLLLMQQRQNLFAQVLHGHPSHQHFGESSYGHFKASMPTGNAHIDQLGLHQIQKAPQIVYQMAGLTSGHSKFDQVNHDVNYPDSSIPLHLPGQMVGHPTHLEDWSSALSQKADNVLNSDPVDTPAVEDGPLLSSVLNMSQNEAFIQLQQAPDMRNCASLGKPLDLNQTKEDLTAVHSGDKNRYDLPNEISGTSDLIASVSEHAHDMPIFSEPVCELSHVELPPAIGLNNGGMQDVKKSSEKKVKKQKNMKVQSASDLGKGPSKTIPCGQPKQDSAETQETNTGNDKAEVPADSEESLCGSSSLTTGHENESSISSAVESMDSHKAQSLLPTATMVPAKCAEAIKGTLQREDVGNWESNPQISASHRSWRPAPEIKRKSIIEIQMEQQCSAQPVTLVSEPAVMITPSNIHPTPRAGCFDNLENKPSRDTAQATVNTPLKNSKSMKSQLHDLLPQEVSAKASEGDINVPFGDNKGLNLPPTAHMHPKVEVTGDGDDFIEAKDTRKSRKKAAKAKAAGLKASSSAASADFSALLPAVEAGKTTRQPQEELELLPVPPVGPSLADFVPWRGDQVNHSPAPAAWSTELGKMQKPASFRDIQKEQENKAPVQQQILIPTPSKVQLNQSNRGNGSSWQIPGSSPSKTISSVQTKTSSSTQPGSTTSVQSKGRLEDDLLRGSLDQSKQEIKNRGAKSNSVRGPSGVSASRQKAASTIPTDNVFSVSSSSIKSKGEKEEATNCSEAMDFREWCENEFFRLTGSRDTSFLEYCMKQSTSEAATILRENLGSIDHNHEFIDKLLNFKEFLSPDVIDIAFRAETIRKVSEGGHGHQSISTLGTADPEVDMETGIDGFFRGVSKKKSKKGKKVNPSVLGFSIASNRIMMGEIQTVDD